LVMKTNKTYPLPGIETFWMLPAKGAKLHDIINKEMTRISTQKTIEIQVRKDSIAINDKTTGIKHTKTLEAFYPGGDDQAENYLRKLSNRRYYIVAKNRDGQMYLLSTNPISFRYEYSKAESLSDESGFALFAETEDNNTLVRVLTLSLNNLLIDSNFDALKDSNNNRLRS